MEEAEKLVKKIEAANAAYRTGEAAMSDAEYDALLDKLAEADPGLYIELSDKLNEGAAERGAKVQHKWVVGSLDKVKSSDTASLKRFVEQQTSGKLSVSAKVDGISSVAIYRHGKLV